MSAASNVDLTIPCAHVGAATIHHVKRPGDACVDCLKIGGEWVHLRECLSCGHVACCDSSPHRHATAHFHHTKHPIVTSVEAGETWCWCYVDEAFLSQG
jgi:uncharacterized UBP type Zn finger protein